MTHVIVENVFETPLTDADLDGFNARGEPCLAAYEVTWHVTFLSHDRRRMVCHFEAADAEAVRSAMRSANLPFERVWVTDVRTPETIWGATKQASG